MSNYAVARKITKDKIASAYWTLYKRNGFKDVATITEICKFANITRSTFYFYFSNVSEVMDEIFMQIKEGMFSRFDFSNSDEGALEKFFIEIDRIMKDYAEYFVPLVCEYKNAKISFWFRSFLRKKLIDILDLDLDQMRLERRELIDLSINSLINIQLSGFLYKHITSNEIYNLIQGILNDGLKRALDDNFE